MATRSSNPAATRSSASDDRPHRQPGTSRDGIEERQASPIELQDTSSSPCPAHAGSRARHDSTYAAPGDWANLDEVAATTPIENRTEGSLYHHRYLEQSRSSDQGSRYSQQRPDSKHHDPERRGSAYAVPDEYANLDELAATSPVENVRESSVYRHESLEETRTDEQQRQAGLRRGSSVPLPPGEILQDEAEVGPKPEKNQVSRFLTELYTLSYLVFFAFMGTLARVGLAAVTTYPGAPATFGVLWANFGGSLIMGFLIEDRMLFRHLLDAPTNDQQRAKRSDEENTSGSEQSPENRAATHKAHLAIKKTIPLYIGLATGFCGCFTSFSSFIADIFLAVSNSLPTPGITGPPTPRNGGYSFMAMLAVIILTVSLSLSGLYIGAHLAIALEGLTPSIRYPFTRKVLDPLVVILGWGSWLGAVLLSIFPPHDFWRGRIVFGLVLAPLGCLARFYLSLYLNGKVASFPLGTFAANMIGTAVLGMAWDIAHAQIGGVVGCQVLQGVEDGFCGCLTTISTWVAELSSLRRRHSYIYGSASVITAFLLMIAIMGGLKWTDGFSGLLCST